MAQRIHYRISDYSRIPATSRRVTYTTENPNVGGLLRAKAACSPTEVVVFWSRAGFWGWLTDRWYGRPRA